MGVWRGFGGLSARLRYCLGAVSRLLSGRFIDQPAQVFPRQVCVRHSSSQIGVAHGFFNMHGVLAFRHPYRDTAMPQVVLHKLGRELSLFCRSFECTVSDPMRIPALWCRCVLV